MGHAKSPSCPCSDVVVEGCHLSMGLAQSLGLRHQRHSRETVYFAGFDQHQVDNLYLRRVMIYEAVMVGKDGSCRWHKGQEGDVGEHRSVADFP